MTPNNVKRKDRIHSSGFQKVVYYKQVNQSATSTPDFDEFLVRYCDEPRAVGVIMVIVRVER